MLRYYYCVWGAHSLVSLASPPFGPRAVVYLVVIIDVLRKPFYAHTRTTVAILAVFFYSLSQFLCSWICSPLKKYLSVRSHGLLRRKCWKLVFLASEWVGVFSKIYPELFLASPGAELQEVTVSTFSIQLGQRRLLSSMISEKKKIRFDRGL